MKGLVISVFCLLFAAEAYSAAKLTVPQLPPSPYDDTEISTNLVFAAGDSSSRSFAFSLDLTASPSNTVQLAFGTDVDSDGDLSWPETELLVGWRCGGWFFRDKVSETGGVFAPGLVLRFR